MTISLTPSEDDACKTLRTFMLGILPNNTSVIRGQVNRVAEPIVPNFVVMTPIRRERLETNVDQFVDTKATASIAGNVMTVSGKNYGLLKVGSVLFGTGIVVGTQIVTQLRGSVGGTGTYAVTGTQAMSSSVVAAGVLNAMQPTELTIQCDVHGPLGGDNAQRIVNMLLDDYAFVNMTRQGLGVLPLTAENRGQIPFVNAEQQYEDRWVVEACLQVNATVNDIPQEFFDQVVIGFIPVDIVYPA